MKNVIKYYYNLEPDNIYQRDKEYKFNVDGYDYLFLPCYLKENEVKELYEFVSFLTFNGFYCHQFVLNINYLFITIINNIPYILLLILVNEERKITFEDVVSFSNFNLNNNKKNEWFSLWTKKVDYYEYQVSQFGKSYPLLNESFNYFIGMAETSIILLKNTNINYDSYSFLSYRRIKKETSLFDLYNPLNFIFDSKVRNIAEYFKDCFFNDDYLKEELFLFLNNCDWSESDYILFYARMVFPSYYFDLFAEIVYDNILEKNILKIIHKINDYELFLKELYYYLKQFVNMPNIEWLV